MIKRKRKRNPLKDDKKLMRKVAELLAKTIEKEPDGIIAYLLAAELVRRDSLYCEECHSFDIEKDCDWSSCYPEIYDLSEDSTLDMAKEAAEELAQDLGIKDYVNVFRYSIQRIKYEEKKDLKFRPFIDLKKSNLVETDLSGLYLSRAELSGADLSGADLSGADLSESKLAGANLFETDLSGANLSNANLSNANLSNANLSNTDLSGAVLFETDLSGAVLFETDLSGADLAETNFTNAKIDKTIDLLSARNLKHAINLIISNPRKALNNAKKKPNKKNPQKKRGFVSQQQA